TLPVATSSTYRSAAFSSAGRSAWPATPRLVQEWGDARTRVASGKKGRAHQNEPANVSGANRPVALPPPSQTATARPPGLNRAPRVFVTMRRGGVCAARAALVGGGGARPFGPLGMHRHGQRGPDPVVALRQFLAPAVGQGRCAVASFFRPRRLCRLVV